MLQRQQLNRPFFWPLDGKLAVGSCRLVNLSHVSSCLLDCIRLHLRLGGAWALGAGDFAMGGAGRRLVGADVDFVDRHCGASRVQRHRLASGQAQTDLALAQQQQTLKTTHHTILHSTLGWHCQ